MEQHLTSYISSQISQIGLTKNELIMQFNWLKENYQLYFTTYRESRNRDAQFELVAKYSDHWLAVMAFCDVCYEYGDSKMIERIVSDIRFTNSVKWIKHYLGLRIKFRALSEDELGVWIKYLEQIGAK